MAKLQLSNVEISLPPTEISTVNQRKFERLLAIRERQVMNRQAISDRVNVMLIDDAKQRLVEVKSSLKEINRDLLLYEQGVTEIPKLVESGLRPGEWAHRAGLARGYFLLERRLLIDRLMTLKPDKTGRAKSKRTKAPN